MEGIIIGNADNADLVREGDKYYLDLYAQWDKISYQISYQSNGATSETMENSTHYYDTESKINKNKYVKEYNDTADIARMILADFYKEINSFDYLEEIPTINEQYLEQILKNVFDDKKMIISVIKKA